MVATLCKHRSTIAKERGISGPCPCPINRYAHERAGQHASRTGAKQSTGGWGAHSAESRLADPFSGQRLDEERLGGLGDGSVACEPGLWDVGLRQEVAGASALAA
eukprot:UN4800